MYYGDRIRLRAIEEEDIPKFVAWLNDPEVRDGLKINLPLSMLQERKWFESMNERPLEEHPLVIEVKKLDSWHMIGNCGLFGINWRDREAEFGIFIGDKEYWSKGYGREATKRTVTHAFDDLNLNRVFLKVHADNPRAIKAYEYAGFVHEGRMRQAVYKHGNYIDILIMSILQPEWKVSV